MNRVRALLWKDLRVFFGDRKAMLITFIVPIGIASFFGMVFGGASGGGGDNSKKISVLVVDQDKSPLTAKILDGLKKDSMADPKLVDEAEAGRQVKDGKVAVAIVFPKGFGTEAPRAMFSGTPPTVAMRYDPSKSMEMQAVQGSIMQVAMKEISQQAFSPSTDYSKQISDIDSSTGLSSIQKADFHRFFADLKQIGGQSQVAGGRVGAQQPFILKAEPQTAPNDKGDPDAQRNATLAHTFAGMAMQGVMFYGINAAMAILRDRRMGVWKRLRASPATLTELLLGKGLANSLIGAFVLAGVLLFGMAVFKIHVSGSWIGLGLVLGASALMVSAFGLLVASLGRTEEQSRGLSILAVLTMVMLGGGWFPSFMMPEWVQKLSLVVPVRWALDGFDAMLWRGQGLSSALTPVAGLLAFTIVFAVVAGFRFKMTQETA